MEIDAVHLIVYFTIWTIFYFYLSHYIAELSRRRWTTWVQSEDSDEILMEALEVIVNEIDDRIHDKLEQFQSSFFGSVGQMVKKGKDLDPMNNIRKAAKDGDWTSMLVEYAANKSGLGALIGSQEQNTAVNEGETSDKTPLKPKSIKDFLHK